MIGVLGSLFQQHDLLLAVLAALLCGLACPITLSMPVWTRTKGEVQRLRAHIAQLEASQTALIETSSTLSQALEAAKAANKSKSAFLASMSHQLRTPLNAMLGFSETVLAEPFGPVGSPRYREYLECIHTSGTHLSSLIDDILDIAPFDVGHDELQEELFDTAVEIANTARMMLPQAKKAGVELVVDMAPGLPCMRGDRRRFCQVLLNLLSNALKFTPANGTVTVRAYRTPEGMLMQVNDTGVGIAAQDFSKVLEPFGQVDSSLARKYEGTGLGLPLTRQMVELHGGNLALDSVLGQGTCVTVSLPAWRLNPRENATAECAARRLLGGLAIPGENPYIPLGSRRA